MVNWYVWCRVLFVCLGGFLFGYELGSMSGVVDMVGYRQALNLSYSSLEYGENDTEGSCDADDDVKTAAIIGLIVSLLAVGSFFGSLVAGVLSDFAGRKPALIVGSLLVAFGGALHMAAVNLWMVFPSRILSGLGNGILYQVTPLYVSEISPAKQRGRLVTFVNVYFLGANTLGNVLNLFLKDLLFGWRISIGVQFVMGTALALGMLLLPRSPRWLAKRHRDGEALKIMNRIFKDPDRARTQLEEIKSTVSSTHDSILQTLKHITQWKMLQRLLLGFFLFVIGRFTGINFIPYFSVIVFCNIGLPGFAVSIAVPVVGLLSLLISLVLVDKFGRKPLILIGLAVACASHIVSASLILGFDLENSSVAVTTVAQIVSGYFVLVMVCVFFGFVAFLGNLSWVVVNEIFPLRNRGVMVAIATSGFWVGLISSNQIAAVLIRSPLSISGTLYLFAAVSFFLYLYVLLLLPETKGLTLEKMEEVFSKPWLERTNVLHYLCCGCLRGRTREGSSSTYQVLQVAVNQETEDVELQAIADSSEDNVPLIDHEELIADTMAPDVSPDTETDTPDASAIIEESGSV